MTDDIYAGPRRAATQTQLQKIVRLARSRPDLYPNGFRQATPIGRRQADRLIEELQDLPENLSENL